MTNLTSAKVSFLNQVINTFDVHAYPIPPRHSVAWVMSNDYNTRCDQNNRVEEIVYALPGVLQTQIYNTQPNQSSWILTTGILDPTRVKDETTEKAITASAKERLKQLGQESLLPLHTARKRLFSYMFQEAYARASEKEKDQILTDMRPLRSTLYNNYSKFQKTCLKIEEVAGKILSNIYVKIALGAVAALLSLYLFSLLQTAIIVHLTGHLIPAGVNILINKAPLILIKICSAAVAALEWIIQHQLSLYVFFAVANLSTRPYPLLNRVTQLMGKAFLFPTNLIKAIYDLTYDFALKAFSLSYRTQSAIATSLTDISDRGLRKHYIEEGKKAYDLWMQLIDAETAAPAVAPIPVPA